MSQGFSFQQLSICSNASLLVTRHRTVPWSQQKSGFVRTVNANLPPSISWDDPLLWQVGFGAGHRLGFTKDEARASGRRD